MAGFSSVLAASSAACGGQVQAAESGRGRGDWIGDWLVFTEDKASIVSFVVK